VDGTLLPCWSWADRPQLYSGKHKTTGMNVQIACTLDGRLVWISDPIDGSRHDTYCLKESGVLLTPSPDNWMGDKGYVGNRMLTPIKKPKCRELLDWEKEFNTQINKIRYVIEQVIANFKPGGSCTPTTGDPLTPSRKPSQRWSPYTSTPPPE
jgi:hypothetical protein